jgi:hypothetical protein
MGGRIRNGGGDEPPVWRSVHRSSSSLASRIARRKPRPTGSSDGNLDAFGGHSTAEAHRSKTITENPETALVAGHDARKNQPATKLQLNRAVQRGRDNTARLNKT